MNSKFQVPKNRLQITTSENFTLTTTDEQFKRSGGFSMKCNYQEALGGNCGRELSIIVKLPTIFETIIQK